jgi:hypothetical protein
MTLAAQTVVAAIAARLSTRTAAGTRVYTDRLYPITEDLLPAWRITDLSEQVEDMTVHWPPVQKHTMIVGLQACVVAASGIDATFNALRLQALQALFDTQGHSTLGIDVQMMERGTGPLEPIEAADRQIAQRTIQLSVIYRTRADNPETIV